MGNEQNGILFKIRSYSSCFKEGFELYTNNFKLLLKFMWISLLVYAIYATAVTHYLPIYMQDIQNGTSGIMQAMIVLTATVIIAIAVSSLVYGHLFTMLNKYKENGYLPQADIKAYKKDVIHYVLRNLKSNLWMLLYTVVLTISILLILLAMMQIAGKNSSIVFYIFAAIITLAIYIVAFTPLIYIGTKYMMEDGTGFIKVMKNSFGTAMRHWGSIFVLSLITGIVVCIAVLVVDLPDYIILIVNHLSKSAIADGDPSGLPGTFGIFSTIVMIVCAFLQIYVDLFMIFPFIFLYGSIEAEEKERQELNRQNENRDEDMMASLNTND